MALDVQLILLEPTDIEFLARSTALELTSNVLFVVTHDPVDVDPWSAGAIQTE